MFAFGTRMLVKRILPVAVPRMPHFAARASITSKPGMSGVTRNAVTLLLPSRRRRAGHHRQDVGDAAVGDVVLGAVEDVCLPSSVGVAVVCTLPASEPASGSVSAKAQSFEPSIKPGQPLRLLFLGAEQHQRPDADRVVRIHEHRDAGIVPAEHFHRLQVLLLVEAESTILGGDREAVDAEVAPARRSRHRGCAASRSIFMWSMCASA